ncbi:hypothetical protein H2203_005412 [Taxawa tesnikishii (nom. ined.)]|nr:hypothetical protein H2203_005412 [Dothideales sp. JES 119]
MGASSLFLMAQRCYQLRLIEQSSPQIAGADAELWLAFVKRDIPNWEAKLIEPKNPASWWKVYKKLMKEDNAQRMAAEEQLKAAMNRHKNDKTSHSTKILHTVIPQANKVRWGGESRGPAMGQRALANAKDTKAKLTILKRQINHEQRRREATHAIPFQALSQKRSQVQQAPKDMINQYKKPTTPAPAASRNLNRDPAPAARNPVFVSRPGPLGERDRALNAAMREEAAKRQAMEERLRRIKSGNSAAAASASPSTSRNATPSGSQQPQPAQPSRTSTASPAPQQVRKRPAHSAFLPAKKRKV